MRSQKTSTDNSPRNITTLVQICYRLSQQNKRLPTSEARERLRTAKKQPNADVCSDLRPGPRAKLGWATSSPPNLIPGYS
ncbi:Hypothetical protein NTJ_12511 [Nesidiocoris tenuis]|uniref:Uncharacterized protein n=1 Tax=Nesidiocoris tenuis TaxID=355587 RepID=A0ABN7B765_9HEMI|nr:Hypothetical protein NTJ_12511 [Nesidiocoris tenuis]